jgi:glutathione S-transferase
MVRAVGDKLMGKDPLADVPGLSEYCMRMEKRPHVIKIRADAAADRPQFMAHLKSLYQF